jgi:hypothetical protein
MFRGSAVSIKLISNMKAFLYLALLLVLCGILTPQTSANEEKRKPVLLELFTSEGCESCPPADKYLNELLTQQPVDGVEIIALSLHVDYWNRLGWTDPFSSAQFSNRQGYYSQFFKHPDVFTPQFVVDGTRELIGREGNKSIIESAKNPKGVLTVNIERENAGVLSLRLNVDKLPQVTPGDKALVVFAAAEDDLTSKPSSGENNGRKLKHMAVARYLKTVGDVASEPRTILADLTLGKSWKRNDLSVIAFVQEAKSRRILGVAKLRLKN